MWWLKKTEWCEHDNCYNAIKLTMAMAKLMLMLMMMINILCVFLLRQICANILSLNWIQRAKTKLNENQDIKKKKTNRKH